MSPEALLAALRAGGSSAEVARAALAQVGDPGLAMLQAERRAGVARLLVGSLLPGDHAIACWLLTQEVAAHVAAGRGASETLYALVAAVARYADPEDALLLWRAREATPETREGVDVEQIARAGVERVRRVLRAHVRADGVHADEAARALEWLERGVALGATSDLPGYFAWADERFGLHVAGPT